MIAGFGVGGGHSGPFYFDAPALAKPATLDAGGSVLALNDWVGGDCYPWATPWFTQGPKDCSDWLFQFAQQYSEAMGTFENPVLAGGASPLPSAYQPARLIFDIEHTGANCCDPCVYERAYASMVGDLQNPGGGDSRFADANFSVWGAAVQNTATGAWDGVYSIGTGPTLSDMFDAWRVFRPADATSPPAVRRWIEDVVAQSHCAALDRAVRSEFNQDPTVPPAVSGFLHGAPPKYSNYNAATGDADRDNRRPPYDVRGNPKRRYSYIDVNGFHQSYHNHADFHSPVSYCFVRGVTPVAGKSMSDWTVQQMRERMDAILFSSGAFPIVGDPAPTEAITPWIAGVNLYFSHLDHHRTLLALLRGKGGYNHECVEYNVFLDNTLSTHDQMMTNWTRFRHILDQVYGFDLDTSPGANEIKAGTATFGVVDWKMLNVGNFQFASVDGVDDVAIGTTFKVAPALTTGATGSGAIYTPFAVADSALLRVNVELVVEYAGARPDAAGPQADHDFNVSAQLYNAAKGGWINLQLNRVCDDAFSPGLETPNPPVPFPLGGIRMILTGTIENPLRHNPTGSATSRQFVQWSVGDPAGSIRANILLKQLGGPAPYTVHFDLVQIIGVDANESSLDWNHDNTLNVQDLLQFTRDLAAKTSNGQSPVNSQIELRALDVNNDGLLHRTDACAFRDALSGAGHLLPGDANLFRDLFLELFQMEPCGP